MDANQRRSIDESYKLLFSEPRMIADLLVGYVKQDWVEKLDFSSLQSLPTDFITEWLDKRHGDCIWRVKWRDSNRWLYVYVALEFQSKPDRFMPIRLMTYVSVLYERVAKQRDFKPHDKFPSVLPLVLYNGEQPWNYSTNLRDLIDIIPGGIEQYIPEFEFFLIEERKFKDHPLLPTRNLVSALFALETSADEEKLFNAFKALKVWLEQEGQKSLNKAFLAWMKGVLLPSKWEHIDMSDVSDLEGVQSMLEVTVERWKKEWKREGLAAGREEGIELGKQEGIALGKQEGIALGKQEGIELGKQEGIELGKQKGLEIGRAEGRAEGQRALFVQLMQTKFSTLPDPIMKTIVGANEEQLQAWTLKLLTANSIDEVFQ